jgi:hypothetical protein
MSFYGNIINSYDVRYWIDSIEYIQERGVLRIEYTTPANEKGIAEIPVSELLGNAYNPYTYTDNNGII